MNTPHRLLTTAALVLACAGAAPRHAAAQQGGNCARCVRDPETLLYSCPRIFASGANDCLMTASGLGCAEIGRCPPDDPGSAPIDGAIAPLSPELLENAVSGEGAIARLTHGGDGRSQYHARCNGVVLARAYAPALADRLRTETSSIEL